METLPDKCMHVDIVGSFCDCIERAESADPAARGFCARVKSGNDSTITGDDLAELKKALMDLESRTGYGR